MSSCTRTDEHTDNTLALYRGEIDDEIDVEARADRLRTNLDVPIDVRDGERATYRHEVADDGTLDRVPDPEGNLVDPNGPTSLPIDPAPLCEAAREAIPLAWTLNADGSDVTLDADGTALTFAIFGEHGLIVNRARYYLDLSAAAYLGTEGDHRTDVPFVELDGPEIDLSPSTAAEAVASLAEDLRTEARDEAKALAGALRADVSGLEG